MAGVGLWTVVRVGLCVGLGLGFGATQARAQAPSPQGGEAGTATAAAVVPRALPRISAVATRKAGAGQAQPVEEVVVTGSRILRDPNLGSIAPVQSISAERIARAGEPDISDVLSRIPALLNTNTVSDSGGGAFLSLRGLGEARTLVLVDGRRFVAGAEGSAAVDVDSIPSELIERVEVLTGGASAIYGADAVTGVVNFILKHDYEGLSMRLGGGASGLGDSETLDGDLLWGRNFDQDRGNLTFASTFSSRNKLVNGDRGFTRDNRRVDNLANPMLRFQRGEISESKTPNFFRFFSPDAEEPTNRRFPTGFPIPSADAFSADFTKQFGAAPMLSPAELALIRRAAKAPPRALLPRPTFSTGAFEGILAPANFQLSGVDSDKNGRDDCLDSFTGFNSLSDFAGPGAIGGCFLVKNGKVRPFRDGRISSDTNQSGGDGTGDVNSSFVLPTAQRVSLSLNSKYDLTETLSLFGEAEYAFATTDTGGGENSFASLLTIAPDNPFIPAELQELANSAGGLFLTRDNVDLGRNIDTSRSDTYRFVGGLRGQIENGWNYEIAGNYGKVRAEDLDRNSVIQDRFFAAIDVTTDPQGRPVCRSDLDPSALPPGTPFDGPLFDPGFFTFRPGDGQCVPANLLNGSRSIDRRAVDFITKTTKDRSEITQFVLSANLSGDLEGLLTLPGGPVGFSTGVEYRKERSASRLDPLERGVLPISGPSGRAGMRVGDLPGIRQKGLVFDPAPEARNSRGSFDVKEVFGELSFPLLRGARFADELTLDGAARYSRYSTVGSTLTWNAGASWAPIRDVRLRSTVAQAVRAPNIGELFAPQQGAFFFPIDPCDQDAIDSLKASGDPRGPVREKNCRTAGLPEGFRDPLDARFTGVTQGNPNLREETARTYTAGAVVQPRFLQGLNLSVDYFDIDIDDAISAVGEQDIVNGCFDSATFPANQNCALFTRNPDPDSPQFQGLNFLRQMELNFAGLHTRGIDFSASYDFTWHEDQFNLSVSGTRLDKLDQFSDPMNKSVVNPGLGELANPKYAGNASLSWTHGPLGLHWDTQYLGKQALGGVEIETAKQEFGPSAIAGKLYIHDFSLDYEVLERYQLYGGVNNVTNERPFITETTFPASALGRFFFVGLRVKL